MDDARVNTCKGPTYRTKTGCLVCRKRRKKCDERRPSCLGCERNQLICAWPSQRGHEQDVVPPANSPANALALSPAASREANVLPATDGGPAVLGPVVSSLPALFRHPPAARLVDFYTNVTATRIISRSHIENPFITHFLRISTVSPALQHAILAVSSTHRSFSDPTNRPTSYEHYAVALRGLKTGITAWETCNSVEKIALLATSLALCWYEVIDSNMKGAVMHHLRASGVMMQGLCNDRVWQNDPILGFFMEQHSYLSIVSNIGIEHADYELDYPSLPQQLVELNSGSLIYGFLFGCSHTIYQCIPAIRALARRFRSEGRSVAVEDEYGYLLARTQSWQPDDADKGTEHEQGGRIYQAACLVLLYTTMHASTQPTTELYNQTEPCIALFINNFKNLPCTSAPWTTCMWPALVTGSCMRDAEQRAILTQILSRSVLQMNLVGNVAHWLSIHWQRMDMNQAAYGPMGLEMTIRDLGLVPCIG